MQLFILTHMSYKSLNNVLVSNYQLKDLAEYLIFFLKNVTIF